MPSFAALDMEGVAMRLAGIEAGRDSPSSPAVHSAPDANLAAPNPTFLSAGLGTHLVPHQTPLLVAPGAAAAAAEAAPAAVDVTMHQEMQADAADMTALKEELEAANIRAHAHQVRVRSPSLSCRSGACVMLLFLNPTLSSPIDGAAMDDSCLPFLESDTLIEWYCQLHFR